MCPTVQDCPDPKVNYWQPTVEATGASQGFVERMDPAVKDYRSNRSWTQAEVGKIMLWMTENQANGEDDAKWFFENRKSGPITGSTRGLGWAAAQAVAEAGATVVLHGRSAEAGQARKAELEARGLKADYLAFDMAGHAAVEAAVPTIAARHGGIWGLVNNAGMLLHNSIWDKTAETYE